MIGDQRGLSLVEVLVASLLIAIGLVSVMYVVPISSYGVQEGKQMSTATFLAEQRLEEVRNAAWRLRDASLPTTNPNREDDCLGVSAAGAAPSSDRCARTSPTTCTKGTACATFPDEANVDGFARQVRVTDCSGGAGCSGIIDANLRLVTVTVTYTPLSGAGVGAATKPMSVSLLVARR